MKLTIDRYLPLKSTIFHLYVFSDHCWCLHFSLMIDRFEDHDMISAIYVILPIVQYSLYSVEISMEIDKKCKYPF